MFILHKSDGWLCILHKGLALSGLVISPLAASASSRGPRRASCGKPPDWKCKHGAQLFSFSFFSACSPLSQSANQSLKGSVRPVGKADTFPRRPASVCLPLQFFSGPSRPPSPSPSTSTLSCSGFIFMVQQHGRLGALSSFVSRPLRSLALCAETERPPGRIAFQDLLCERAARQTGGSLDVRSCWNVEAESDGEATWWLLCRCSAERPLASLPKNIRNLAKEQGSVRLITQQRH